MITGMPRIAIAVRDLDAAKATFRNAFGMPVNESPQAVHSLGVRIAMCTPPGGSNIELMSPADPQKPLNASLQKFLDRRGEGLFALMLEAPDPNAEAEELAGRGLNVLPLMAGAGGRDVHPRSTHGVLIRVYPTRPVSDEQAGAPDAGFSGITRVRIAVADLDDAVRVYRDGFGMRLDAQAHDEQRGVRTAVFSPGTGGKIELLSPSDSSRSLGRAVAAFLAAHGEGMYALVLATRDLGRASAALKAGGTSLTPAPEGDDGVDIVPSSLYGAPVHLEQVTVQAASA